PHRGRRERDADAIDIGDDRERHGKRREDVPHGGRSDRANAGVARVDGADRACQRLGHRSPAAHSKPGLYTMPASAPRLWALGFGPWAIRAGAYLKPRAQSPKPKA